jgi:hypothetical protein
MENAYFEKQHAGRLLCLLSLVLCIMPLQAAADDFADYKTAAGTTAEVDLPTISGGYGMVADYFPDGTTEMIDGRFEAEGRLVAAEGTSIYMQRTYGSSQWDLVATVPDTMDPSFIHVSPDGSKIALGLGYSQPLLIMPTSVLSAASPPDLTTAAGVKVFENIMLYYEGDWRGDNRHFIVDGGQWPGPDCEEPYYNDPDCVFESGVGAVDTESADPANHTGVLLATHDGASADVEVDTNDNLIIGIGWLPDDGEGNNRTGEIKVWPSGEWDPMTPNSLDYAGNTRVVAENLLSAAWIGQDAEGNLHVGGGDAYGVGGALENGYAAIIKGGIVDAIADGIRTTPVDDGDKTDTTEYKYFAPDSCQDDTATGILAGDWGRGLAVMWNPSGDESGGCAGSAGSSSDLWVVGVTPRLTIYYPGSAPDSDGDGIPDSADNAYDSYNPSQDDTDGDGYGDVADADYDNDGDVDREDYIEFRSHYGDSGPQSDFDADGDVDRQDYIGFREKYGTSEPWY